MAQLTAEQISFLTQHGIPVAEIFNASGCSSSAERKRKMKELGKKFAYGVTECRAAGHTLRTRNGHCIQCDTSKIAYARRHSKTSIVYVAGSRKCKRVKIGVTENLSQRTANLVSEKYGGADDWVMLATAGPIKNAGLIEHTVQKTLSQYRDKTFSLRPSKAQESYEVFICSAKEAVSVLEQSVPNGTVFKLDVSDSHF
jgi:hypothetical protein